MLVTVGFIYVDYRLRWLRLRSLRCTRCLVTFTVYRLRLLPVAFTFTLHYRLRFGCLRSAAFTLLLRCVYVALILIGWLVTYIYLICLLRWLLPHTFTLCHVLRFTHILHDLDLFYILPVTPHHVWLRWLRSTLPLRLPAGCHTYRLPFAGLRWFTLVTFTVVPLPRCMRCGFVATCRPIPFVGLRFSLRSGCVAAVPRCHYHVYVGFCTTTTAVVIIRALLCGYVPACVYVGFTVTVTPHRHAARTFTLFTIGYRLITRRLLLPCRFALRFVTFYRLRLHLHCVTLVTFAVAGCLPLPAFTLHDVTVC